jgi:hypothetical protein
MRGNRKQIRFEDDKQERQKQKHYSERPFGWEDGRGELCQPGPLLVK